MSHFLRGRTRLGGPVLLLALALAHVTACTSDDLPAAPPGGSSGGAGATGSGEGGAGATGQTREVDGAGGSLAGGDGRAAGAAGLATGGVGGDVTGGNAGADGAIVGSNRDAGWEAESDAEARASDATTERSLDAASDAEAGGARLVDVYLIGGQSNATGQGYTKNLPASFAVDTNVQIYHSADINSGAAANTWIPLRHASEAPDGAGARFGPELGFGNAIQAAYPAHKIALIKHAKSGTNLVTQWAPGSDASDAAHFGPEWKTFVSTVDGGLKALRAQGVTPVIRGMLWQQGESDADLGGSASQQYGQHLSALIGRVRQQWSTPALLFVYGYVYPSSNFGTGRDQVRQGEAAVDQDSGNALAVRGAFVVDTSGLSLRANDPGTPYPNDLIHFGTAGQLGLGERMSAKMREKLGAL